MQGLMPISATFCLTPLKVGVGDVPVEEGARNMAQEHGVTERRKPQM